MAELTYLEAIREALFEEMERDENVFCLAKTSERMEEPSKSQRVCSRSSVNSGHRHPYLRDWDRRCGGRGGAYGHAAGGRDAVHRFHRQRVRHAHPLRRDSALSGVPADADGGTWPLWRLRPRWTLSLAESEAGFIHTPGLKVVYPRPRCDAKGLMKAAIRDDDCGLFFEHKYLYRRIKEELPGGATSSNWEGAVARAGRDVSIITYAAPSGKRSRRRSSWRRRTVYRRGN